MKKFLSLLLAIMMVASLGVVAFAADTFYPEAVPGGVAMQDKLPVAFFADKDGNVDLGSAYRLVGTGPAYTANVYFGEYMYLALVRDGVEDDDFLTTDYASAADYPLVNVPNAAKNIKVSFYNLSEETNVFMDTASAQIVRKKVVNTGDTDIYGVMEKASDSDDRDVIDGSVTDYAYFVQIPVKAWEKYSCDVKLFEGSIKLKRGSGDYEFETEKMEFFYAPIQHTVDGTTYDENTIYKSAKWYKENLWDENDTEFEFTFEADEDDNGVLRNNHSVFVMDLSRQQRPVKLGFDLKTADAEYEYIVANEGDEIDMQFYNGKQTGAFSRKGTLYLYWGEVPGFVYAIADDAEKTLTLLNDKQAAFQEEGADFEGCYAIKTNKLARYLITDKALTITSLTGGVAEVTPDVNSYIFPAEVKVVEKVVEKEVVKEVPVEVVKEVEVAAKPSAGKAVLALVAGVAVGAVCFYFGSKSTKKVEVKVEKTEKKEAPKAEAKKSTTKKK